MNALTSIRPAGRIELRKVVVTEKGFTYPTWRLTGRLDGRRIRQQFKNRDEALGAKCRLEVAAANSGEVKARVTRLTTEQLKDAEAAVAMLGGQSLAAAVGWFQKNYRPPVAAKLLADAAGDFLRDRAQHVRPVVLKNYRHNLARVVSAFPGREVDSISTQDVLTFLSTRPISKKTHNNERGELHCFFEWCAAIPRGWTRGNPVSPIPVFRVTRDLPAILHVGDVAKIMAYVESYAGSARSKLPKACMVPYFALCLFAGVRPSIRTGEIGKIGPDSIDLNLKVIRISPSQSKVKCIRQIQIQPNLATWLTRYPVTKKRPIVPPNAKKMVDHVRRMFPVLSQDIMRHTFISMHVAKFQSLGQAALEAGNSETIIRRHYFNLVSAADAEAFWAISPIALAHVDCDLRA